MEYMSFIDGLIENNYFTYGISGAISLYIILNKSSETVLKVFNNMIAKSILLLLIIFLIENGTRKSNILSIMLSLFLITNMIMMQSHIAMRENMAMTELFEMNNANPIKLKKYESRNLKLKHEPLVIINDNDNDNDNDNGNKNNDITNDSLELLKK